MSARLAVFVSGSGRSLENLAAEIAAGQLDARIEFVLSNKAQAFALARAERLGIERSVLDPERQLDAQAFSSAAFQALEARGIELLVLAGFLRLLVVPPHWLGRVLNIHPSLLPAFGGAGMYGERVQRAVLDAGACFGGCSVHYVTNQYDAGPILVQRVVPVRGDDTPESLAARVFEEEQRALPEALRLHLARDPRSLRALARLCC